MTIENVLFGEPEKVPSLIPSQYMDKEPICAGERKVLSTHDLTRAFLWYSENKGFDDAAKYLNTDSSIASRFLTLAWCNRLKSNGFDFPEKETATWKVMQANFEAFSKQKEEEKAARVEQLKTVDIQEVLRNKASYLFTKLEESLDDPNCNWFELARKLDINKALVPHIINVIEEEQAQLIIGCESKKDYPTVYSTWNDVKSDLLKLSQAQKVTRKSASKKPESKTKAVNIQKLIKSFQYLKSCPEFKVESINPERIIGAKGIWTFETKYRVLNHYVALDEKGLSIQGTTIKNFSEENSISKTLRKPLEVLPAVLEKTMLQNLKMVKDLTTKYQKISSRSNKTTVLLKVDK